MYAFGMVALLGMATFALVSVARRVTAAMPDVRAALLLAVGVGAAWLADFNLFDEWAIVARQDWIALTLTGLVIGTAAYAAQGAYELGKAAIRMVNDQAEGIEVRENLRRVA